MKRTNRMIKTAVAVLLLLATVLCFTACGNNSSTPKVNDASGDLDNGLSWSYESETKTLTLKGKGEMKNFANASDVAWADIRQGVETVVIEDGVTTIGDYAFVNMFYLKKVEIPSSVTAVGRFAFAFCSALEGIEIPESVTSVGDSAFEACIALKSIVLFPSVTRLGARAFALCSSMTDATVVASITELRAETFYGCNSLNNLILGTKIKTVDETAFALASKTMQDAERRDTVEGLYEIVITYVYEDESTAAPEVREEKPNGTAYSYSSPVLEGYEADKTVIEGTLNGTGVKEKVTYKKVAETEPAETEAVETTAAPVAEEEENSTLENVIAVVILAVVIAGIVVGGILLVRPAKKKAPKNNKKK